MCVINTNHHQICYRNLATPLNGLWTLQIWHTDCWPWTTTLMRQTKFELTKTRKSKSSFQLTIWKIWETLRMITEFGLMLCNLQCNKVAMQTVLYDSIHSCIVLILATKKTQPFTRLDMTQNLKDWIQS